MDDLSELTKQLVAWNNLANKFVGLNDLVLNRCAAAPLKVGGVSASILEYVLVIQRCISRGIAKLASTQHAE